MKVQTTDYRYELTRALGMGYGGVGGGAIFCKLSLNACMVPLLSNTCIKSIL